MTEHKGATGSGCPQTNFFKMIVSIFAIILAFAVLFFIIGYVFEVYPMFMVAGLTFLLLSLGVYTTGITVKTGETITQIVPCEWLINWTCEDQIGYYNVTTDIDYEYSTTAVGAPAANLFFALFMLAMAFFSFGAAVIFATPKKDREYQPEREEYYPPHMR